MKNSDIKYDLSKDYSKLHKLLKTETMVIGFIAVIVNNIPNMEYSNLIKMSFSKKDEILRIGDITMFDSMFNECDFIKFCEQYNVSYIDFNKKLKIKYTKPQIPTFNI